MLKIALCSLCLCLPPSIFSQQVATEKKISVKAIGFDQLQPLLHQENDTVYVVNFWATWCAPCIKELPYFEKLGNEYRNDKLKIILVSLDFANQVESRLIPFIEKNKLKNEVVLLADTRADKWIPLIDKNWSGAIPATLIYGKGFRQFYPHEFTYEKLDEIVEPLLKKQIN